jgi:hypothetical protein
VVRVAALLLVPASLCGCRSTAASAPSVADVVPWVNRPLSVYVVPAAKLVRYSTAAPPCRATQLRVTEGRGGVGLGNALERLVFTNTAAKPCLLAGYPTITAEGEAGSRTVLRTRHGGTYFGTLVAADLRPGGHVFLDLATGTGCEGGRKPTVHYRDPVFILPQGGSVHAGRVSISENCGLSMSDFGLPARYSQPRPATGTPGTLQAHLALPLSVRAGATLHFTVSLRNPTKTTVRLKPCPAYTEALNASDVGGPRSFALNCDSVHTIPAHERVRYAMQLTVPRRAVPGFAKVGWNLNTPNGPFGGGTVQIVPY